MFFELLAALNGLVDILEQDEDMADTIEPVPAPLPTTPIDTLFESDAPGVTAFETAPAHSTADHSHADHHHDACGCEAGCTCDCPCHGDTSHTHSHAPIVLAPSQDGIGQIEDNAGLHSLYATDVAPLEATEDTPFVASPALFAALEALPNLNYDEITPYTEDASDEGTAPKAPREISSPFATPETVEPPVEDPPVVLDTYVSGDAGGYNVAINFTGDDWTPELQQAFISASEFISDVVLADIPDIGGTYNIDDIEIDASLTAIDGAGGVLGSAGPTALRTDSGLTATAQMQFDTADAQDYLDAGLWEDIVLHEMLHAMGVGSLWAYAGLTQGSVETDDLIFTGANALAVYQTEFADLAATDPTATNGVPIETHGGDGTAGGHWDEALFGNELMTGFIDAGNYLSDMTFASLEDLGYDTFIDDVTRSDDLVGARPSGFQAQALVA